MNKILCHIDGPSGSGKTTLVKRIEELHLPLVIKDLDEFDDEACTTLGLDSTQKAQWTEADYNNLVQLRTKLMNQFVETSTEPIVFAGSNREEQIIIPIHTDHKFLLDVDAETSARRAYERSQTEDPKYRRTLEELPLDIKEAQEVIDILTSEGYEKVSTDQVIEFIKNSV